MQTVQNLPKKTIQHDNENMNGHITNNSAHAYRGPNSP